MVTADAVLRRVLGQMSASCPRALQSFWARSAWIAVLACESKVRMRVRMAAGGRWGRCGPDEGRLMDLILTFILTLRFWSYLQFVNH